MGEGGGELSQEDITWFPTAGAASAAPSTPFAPGTATSLTSARAAPATPIAARPEARRVATSRLGCGWVARRCRQYTSHGPASATHAAHAGTAAYLPLPPGCAGACLCHAPRFPVSPPGITWTAPCSQKQPVPVAMCRTCVLVPVTRGRPPSCGRQTAHARHQVHPGSGAPGPCPPAPMPTQRSYDPGGRPQDGPCTPSRGDGRRGPRPPTKRLLRPAPPRPQGAPPRTRTCGSRRPWKPRKRHSILVGSNKTLPWRGNSRPPPTR